VNAELIRGLFNEGEAFGSASDSTRRPPHHAPIPLNNGGAQSSEGFFRVSDVNHLRDFHVIRLLSECCAPVTKGQTATCSLMVMQEIRDNDDAGFEHDQHARTEVELYDKAIALLEKCKVETRFSRQEIREAEHTAEASTRVV